MIDAQPQLALVNGLVAFWRLDPSEEPQAAGVHLDLAAARHLVAPQSIANGRRKSVDAALMLGKYAAPVQDHVRDPDGGGGRLHGAEGPVLAIRRGGRETLA